jgi:hypothetical protein
MAGIQNRFISNYHGNIEYPGGFGESNRAVDDRLSLEVGGSKKHLRLKIDKCHRRNSLV